MEAFAISYHFVDPAVMTGAARDHEDLYPLGPVQVEWRGGETWAVTRLSRVWCEAVGEWEWEPSPSSRSDEFIARTRYRLDEALSIGARLAAEHENPVNPT